MFGQDHYIDYYLALLKAGGRSEKTIRTYSHQFAKFVSWVKDQVPDSTDSISDEFLDFLVCDITTEDLLDYRNYLVSQNLKPNSIQAAFIALGSFYRWMYQEGIILHQPAETLERLRIEERPRWLDSNEKYRLLRVAISEGNARNEAIIRTLLMTGVRVSELLNLTPDDVIIDRNKGSLVVHSSRSVRVIPLVKAYRQFMGPYVVKNRASSRWLFDSQRGEQLTMRGVEHICAELGKKADILDLTPHVLRHTFARGLVSEGINLNVVALLMGVSERERMLVYKDIDSRARLDS